MFNYGSPRSHRDDEKTHMSAINEEQKSGESPLDSNQSLAGSELIGTGLPRVAALHRQNQGIQRNGKPSNSSYLALTLSKDEFQNFLREKYGERQPGLQEPKPLSPEKNSGCHLGAAVKHQVDPHKKINMGKMMLKRQIVMNSRSPPPIVKITVREPKQ